MQHRCLVGLVVFSLLAAACTPRAGEPEALAFAESADLPTGEPLLSLESEGVSVQVVADGECARIIEYVPDYGYLIDDFCPPPSSADPFGHRFQTPSCPVIDPGDECADWLPGFVVGRTVAAAAYVCIAAGRVEVRNGWWLALNEDVFEAFPLDADGVRLDSLSNELDGRMQEKCAISDPVLEAARLVIEPGGYQLPITVELDNGAAGSFLLHEGFEPYVYEATLPVGLGPMGVVVFAGSEGQRVGEVVVPDAPRCDAPIVVLELDGPTVEWRCEASG